MYRGPATDAIELGELEIGLVNERGRGQGVAVPLAAEIAGSELVQLVLPQDEHLLHRERGHG